MLIAYTVTGGMKSDPYANLPVMAPPTCGVAVAGAVGDGADVVVEAVAVAVTVGIGVDTAVVGGSGVLVTYRKATPATRISRTTARVVRLRRAVTGHQSDHGFRLARQPRAA